MIIKSHIRGGYRAAAEYMKEQGQNEKTRLVEISDPTAKNLDEAFQKMWEVAGCTRCKKPLHHISINPMKGERLTDAQVLAIVERCEEVYGYKMFHHQRVIIEHIKDGRQHFHVIWNRVSLMSGQTIWPGHHWIKSKQVAREMEKKLGLKRPTPRKLKHARAAIGGSIKTQRGRMATVRFAGIKIPKTAPLRRANHYIQMSGKKYTTGVNRSAVPKLYASRIKTSKEARLTPLPVPMRPMGQGRGWPLAAILDWKSWGRLNPRAFFAKWPELGR